MPARLGGARWRRLPSIRARASSAGPRSPIWARSRGVALVAGRILWRALVAALRFAPLGFFAVFVLPDQAGRLRPRRARGAAGARPRDRRGLVRPRGSRRLDPRAVRDPDPRPRHPGRRLGGPRLAAGLARPPALPPEPAGPGRGAAAARGRSGGARSRRRARRPGADAARPRPRSGTSSSCSRARTRARCRPARRARCGSSGAELDRARRLGRAHDRLAPAHERAPRRPEGSPPRPSLRVPRIGRWLNVRAAARAGVEQGPARGHGHRAARRAVPFPLAAARGRLRRSWSRASRATATCAACCPPSSRWPLRPMPRR